MSAFFDFPEWMKPRKPISDPNDPIYDPAKHWENDYFIDEPYEPPYCYACDNTGFSDHGSYFDPPSPCSRCEEDRAMLDEEPEEIDPELMGVPL